MWGWEGQTLFSNPPRDFFLVGWGMDSRQFIINPTTRPQDFLLVGVGASIYKSLTMRPRDFLVVGGVTYIIFKSTMRPRDFLLVGVGASKFLLKC